MLARVFTGQIPSCGFAEKLCAQDLSSGVQTLGDGTCIASLAGSEAKRAELLARVFQDKFHQCDCAEKLCAQDLSSGVQPLGDGTCIASLAGSDTKNAQLLARVFRTNFINTIVPKTVRPRPAKVSKP